MNLVGFLLLLIVFLPCSGFSHPLESVYSAHGGLEVWRQYGTLEYDLKNFVAADGSWDDHQVIDLKSRKAHIKGKNFKIGWDGQVAWISPPDSKFPAPPRFYALTPFYFFGMPFVFADSGAIREDLGDKVLNGKTYRAVRISYDSEIGDTPEDNYVVYIEKETNRLKLVHYIVTYPMFTDGKKPDELERHAVLFAEWQKAGDLVVPRRITLHGWSGGKLGQAERSATFENVQFRKERPVPESFQMPENAKVDESLKTN